ncbi:MAG: alanine--tRNA ligase, partial [Acidobacteria bacterium]|nr:alanine--tRNA ligase [Acidobacteriota bacterium]
FEMLGNFSFGDYFKAEAIEWGWDLVTRVWGLPPEHLFASVFEQDDEAFELWRTISGLPAERVVRCGEKDNFWAMGDTGPCGPCSEIFVDRHPERPAVSWDEGTDSGRYLEIWNLVFMQFERAPGGATTPLPKPSIDTGAGLERVAAVLAGVDSNYDTDLFRPILDAAAALAGVRYGAAGEGDVSLRVVADHLRAIAFLLADGVIPSNEGRGYVLRRLLRRAVRHGMRLGFEEPFLCRLLPVVDEAMAGAYPELAATRSASETTVRAEEEKFLGTLAIGSKMVQEAIETAKRDGSRTLDGAAVFRLYDTYGLPVQVLREIVEEERFALDEAGFEAALAEQRARSRAAGSEARKWQSELELSLAKELQGRPSTSFEGYENLSIEGVRILAVRSLETAPDERDETFESAELSGSLATGQHGVVVVDRTVFYSESGGQVGDRGEMRWPGGSARVIDTQRSRSGHVLHNVEVVAGRLDRPFPSVQLLVDPAHRLPTQRNHTATHLLHAALREVLGEGVRQAGSLVDPEHLRFDFTHSRPMTDEERERVEARVNEWVLRAVDTRITADRDFKEAVAAGAMALFGEKYGDRVRTVEVPGVSLELCGGCHVRNTGEIGPFVLRAERGVASGVRRIEARTGEGALDFLKGRDAALRAVEAELGGEGGDAAGDVHALKRQIRERDQELAKLRLQLVSGGAAERTGESEVEGIRVLVREVPAAPGNELRNVAEVLRGKLGSGVVVIGARAEEKVSLVAAVSEDVRKRVPAGKLLREVAALVGGSGGGRDDFAQAGGKQPEKLAEALERVPELVRAMIASA